MKYRVSFLLVALAFCSAYALSQAGGQTGETEQGDPTQQQVMEQPAQIVQPPSVGNLTSNSARVIWKTSDPNQGELKYRSTDSPQWKSASDAGSTTEHVVDLTGLKPGQKYEFYVVAGQQEGQTSGQFETLAPGAGNRTLDEKEDRNDKDRDPD